MTNKIELWQGDITELEVDAIVNAANKSLLGGGGVDGKIHSVAGKELKEECRKLGGAETGEAKITNGYNLPARYVIHTVGPVYRDGEHGEPEQLQKCYVNSLKLAQEKGLKTVAFPAISTGIYRYPLKEATKIAIDTAKHQLDLCDSIEKVLFVAYDEETFNVYQEILNY